MNTHSNPKNIYLLNAKTNAFMKKSLWIFLLFLTIDSQATNPESLYSDDVYSAESICKAFLSSLSSITKNEERLNNLFLPHSLQIDATKSSSELVQVQELADFISSCKTRYNSSDTKISSLKHTVRQFGNIASVFQTWRLAGSLEGQESKTIEGINSFQLVYSEKRWWIVNLMWDHQTSDKIIDEAYIK